MAQRLIVGFRKLHLHDLFSKDISVTVRYTAAEVAELQELAVMASEGVLQTRSVEGKQPTVLPKYDTCEQ